MANRIKGITIEIDGNTDKLTKALSHVDSALKVTQSNLRDLNKALQLDPGNSELLKDKQIELSNAITNTKTKLEAEKKALEQMKNTEGFDANSKAARDLKIQIDLDTQALKELEKEAKQSSSVLGSQFQAAGAKIEALGSKISAVGDKISAVGGDLTKKLTTPIVTAFGAAVKATADFDAEMSKVQAISGATGEELDKLRSKAKEMGEMTKFSATEAAEAMNYMAMAGWKTDDMLQGIAGVMNLAAASGEELGTVSDIVTDALTAFGMGADQAGRFADVLAAAAANANTNVSMMGESFKYVGPVAGAMGYSIEDVSVALGLMANSGIKADQAGTSLRNMIQRMAKPTKESDMAMQRLGLTLADEEGNMLSLKQIMDQLRQSYVEINMPLEQYNAELDELDASLENGTLTQKKYEAAIEELNKQAFGAEGAEKARAAAMLGGTRAMAGLLAITNASEEDYEKLTKAINESGGAAENMANTMLQNLSGQLTILKSKTEAFAISIGEILMPKLLAIVDKAQAFMDKLNQMDESEKKQIIKMAAFAASIGPVLLAVGKVTTKVGGLVSFFGKATKIVGMLMSSMGGLSGILTVLTGPVGIVLATVGALSAAFAHLYKTNEEFRTSIQGIADIVKNNLQTALEAVRPALENLGQKFGELFALLSEKSSSFLEKLAPAFEFITRIIAGVVSGIAAAVGPIIDTISSMVEFITAIFEAFFALLDGDFERFFAAIDKAWGAWLNGLINLINAQIQYVIGFFSAFGIDLKALFSGIMEKISTVVSNTLTLIQDKWKTGMNALKNAASAALDNIKNVFSGLKTKLATIFNNLVEDMKEWGRNLIDGLFSGIREKIDGAKESLSGIGDMIKNAFSSATSTSAKSFSINGDAIMKNFAEDIRKNSSLIANAFASSFDAKALFSSQAAVMTSKNVSRENDSALAKQPLSINVVLQGDADRLFRVVSVQAERNREITGQVFNI